jgi:phage/plasmid-like protein (TIGR03299 family)
MAHQITIRENGYAEMAFVGDTPWHGLGQQLDKEATIETWCKSAGMDWTIEQTPAMYQPKEGINCTIPERYVQYRSDTLAPLSVVSERYKPVQPIEVLEFFRDLMDESGFRLHTAGTLFGGKRMWALAETGKFAEVVKGDGIGGFLLLSTSADKSLATTARFTSVRVVCNNTLGLANSQDNQTIVSINHMSEFDHVKVKEKLGCAVAAFDQFMLQSKFLANKKLKTSAAENIVKHLLFSEAVVNDPDYDFYHNRPFNKIMQLYNGEAKGHDLVAGTRWGLLNSITEYYDHHHPARTPDARLNNTWFGRGDTMKDKAVKLLLAA